MPAAITATAAPAAAPAAAVATITAAEGRTHPSPGFADALAAQTGTPTVGQAGTQTVGQPTTSTSLMTTSVPGRLPTVALGTMLASLAGQPTAPEATPFGAVAPGAGDAVTASGAASRPLPDGAGAAVLKAGERYLGVPYLWGGTSARTGFDCSGFVQQVFSDLGVSLPRVSADQSKVGVEVGGLQNAQPGDLLFWRGTGGRPNHIAIYAGNGQMLDAPRTGEVVGYRDVRSAPPDSVRRVSLPG